MWISFAKFSSLTKEENLGSIWGAIGEVSKLIEEQLHCITVQGFMCRKRCILSKLRINVK